MTLTTVVPEGTHEATRDVTTALGTTEAMSEGVICVTIADPSVRKPVVRSCESRRYVGASVGKVVGAGVGEAVGEGVGLPLTYVGDRVGVAVGSAVGDAVGRGVGLP